MNRERGMEGVRNRERGMEGVREGQREREREREKREREKERRERERERERKKEREADRKIGQTDIASFAIALLSSLSCSSTTLLHRLPLPVSPICEGARMRACVGVWAWEWACICVRV